MPNLLIIIASTRPNRIGLPVGRWFEQFAREHAGFDIKVADLLEINLPLMNESKHPQLAQYEHEHTKQWSRIVNQADAVALVMPEYNYAMTAPLVNAIDYLFREWNYKPVGLVSYGGASGGLRAAQMAKQVVTSVRMMPMTEGVSIHFAAQHMMDGAFNPPESVTQAAKTMLDEMVRWEEALRPMREIQRATLSS